MGFLDWLKNLFGKKPAATPTDQAQTSPTPPQESSDSSQSNNPSQM
jgi:hypothetical protein